MLAAQVSCVPGDQAGHEVILQCESDPGAQQVLSENFPGVLLVPDVRFLAALPRVRTLALRRWRSSQLLCVAFPSSP